MNSSTLFFNILTEFVNNLALVYPDNLNLTKASNALANFSAISAIHSTMSRYWYDLAFPLKESIEKKESEKVCEAFNNCNNEIVKSIQAHTILANPEVDTETKNAVWQYLYTLTILSEKIHHVVVVNENTSNNNVTMKPPSQYYIESVMNLPDYQQPQAPPVPVALPPVPAKPTTPADVIGGITDALPKIFDTLNQFLKQGSDKPGENPMADLLRQMINPNSLNTGIANNIAANMMEDTAPVMSLKKKSNKKN